MSRFERLTLTMLTTSWWGVVEDSFFWEAQEKQLAVGIRKPFYKS